MVTYTAKELNGLTFDKHIYPCEFRDEENVVPVSSWVELSIAFLRWLLENGHLCMHKVPVANHAGRGKYLINSEMRHEYRDLDANWERVGAYYIDTKYDADHHRKNMLEALRILGVTSPNFRISFRQI